MSDRLSGAAIIETVTTTMNPVPELHLQPDPQARYALVDEVLAVTKRAQVTAMGFVGNEAYANQF